MKTIISRNDFGLFEIGNEFKENFKECTSIELSDFQKAALEWVGKAFRQDCSQHFWNNGRYCWYTDETQTKKQCVWMTKNGIPMLEDLENGNLYRIICY